MAMRRDKYALTARPDLLRSVLNWLRFECSIRLEILTRDFSLNSLRRYQCAIILNSLTTRQYCWLMKPKITSAASFLQKHSKSSTATSSLSDASNLLRNGSRVCSVTRMVIRCSSNLYWNLEFWNWLPLRQRSRKFSSARLSDSNCLKIGSGGTCSFWLRQLSRVWTRMWKQRQTRSEPSRRRKRERVAVRSQSLWTRCQINGFISANICMLLCCSKRMIHWKMASTRTGNRFSYNNRCRRAPHYPNLFSSFRMAGKASSRASLMRLAVRLIRSHSSERVLITTRIMSLKYAKQTGQRKRSPGAATQREKNLVNISSHSRDCSVIQVDKFCLISNNTVSTNICAFSSLNLLQSPPPSASISLKTCRNFLRHYSALVLRLLFQLRSSSKTCLKKSGRSKESSKCGTSSMVISQSSKNQRNTDPPTCIFSAKDQMKA